MESRATETGNASSDADAERSTPAENPVVRHVNAPRVFDGMARRLLDAGRRHFVERGYQQASVAEIAEEAGTSVGLVYYHFSNKQGLYSAIWADYQQQQSHQTHQVIKLLRSAGVEDGRMLFLAGTRAYMANSWENRDLVKLVHNHDAPPGFAAERRAMIQEWLAMNRKLLKMPDDLSGQVLLEMTVGALSEASRSIAECAAQDEAEEVADIAMRIFTHMLGYAADGEEVERLTTQLPSLAP